MNKLLPLVLILSAVVGCGPLPLAGNADKEVMAASEALLRRAAPGMQLEGEWKIEGDWAFFLGNTVDASGQAATPPGGISSDTVILLRRVGGEWTVVDHGIGISDAFYLEWPTQHGAPEELFR